MTNQEIFDSLAELEQALFYKSRNPEELAPFQTILMQMHRDAKTLLCQWHNLTGCSNDPPALRFTVSYWQNLKHTEVTLSASGRDDARARVMSMFNIPAGSIIQIKEEPS